MYSLDSSPDSEDEGIGKKEKKKKKVKKKKKKVSATEFSKVNCR